MAAAQTLEIVKTITASLEELRREHAVTSAQVSELHLLITRLDSLSAKLDMLDQRSAEPAAKPVPKKRTVTKKPVADEEELVSAEPKALPKKKAVKKAADEEEPIADSDPEVPPSKPRAKKAPKAVASEAKPAREINIMQYFNQEYARDPTTFDMYLTKAIKKEIAETNEADLADLTGAELAKKKQALYYHYVKDNHQPALQAMKKAFIASEKSKSIQLLENDTDA